MANNKVKVFAQVTKLVDMKSIESAAGYYLDDVINTAHYETYVEETLYTSLNQIRFYYPTTGANASHIKNGSHVLYPTPTGYNLYTIDSITITTDDEVLQVDAQHYSVNFMKDSAHEIAVGVDVGFLGSIAQKLKDSPYVSEEFELRGDGVAEGFLDLTEDTYISSLSNATIGSLLVGANSFLRKYYGQYIRRNIDHIEAFPLVSPENGLQTYPLVLGVNVRDMDYTVDTSDIYTTAIISSNSVPELKLPGGEPIGGLDEGIGGSAWSTLESMPDGYRMEAVYKGLPLEIKKQGGLINITISKLVGDSGDDELISPIPGAVVTYVGGVLLIKKGDTTYLNEQIDPHYFYAINVFDIATGNNNNLQFLGKNEFIGKEEHVYTTRIPAHIVQFPVRANTNIKGNAVKYVDFEPNEGINDPDGSKNVADFYHWYFTKFKHYWLDEENKKLLEPTFEARFTVDDMKTLYGKEVVNTHTFRVGDLYNVDAEEYGLQFEAAITKTKYNGLTGQLIEIEFGNKQDLQIEVLKTTNINKPTERKQVKPTKPSNVTSKPIYNGGGDTGGGFDRDRADEWFEDKIKEEGLTDGLGEWLENVLNGDDIRTEEDLFNGDLPYITRTDDTGIPRMEWEPPFVTISTDGDETTPTKLVCYNGSEAVISEVKFKGQNNTVRLYSDGRFYNDRTFLPDNVGFPIVPFPPGTTSSNRTWAPVFDVWNSEDFNKDTEHGDYKFTTSDGSTLEDVALTKENLGYRYNYAINATTKGTVKFETELVMNQRYLREVSKDIRGALVTEGLQSLYQVKDMDDFKKNVLDLAIGKTVAQSGYNSNYLNEDQRLTYYIVQVENGEQPYLRTIYRQFLIGIADKVSRVQESPAVIKDGVITIHFEETGKTYGSTKVRQVIGVDIDEQALEQLSLRHGPFLKEEQGWQRLIFTQPTTKVNDQTVRVNQLLITNDGVSVVDAAISKSEIDSLWAKLSDDERKDFESTYGREWLFNLKNRPEQYDSDDVLLGEIYRSKNNVETGEVFDPFGVYAARDRRDKERIKRIAERYQKKYNFLVSKGYVVPKSVQGQVTYDKIDKYYKSQTQA